MDAEITVAAPDRARIACRAWRPAAPRGALVLLHGVASNATRWSEFAARTALRTDWALLRMDLRGQGRSLWRGRIGMREWCGDLAALLDATGFARAVVGGHCLGANIALEFARRRPERAQGLVLVEPMPRGALAGPMARLALLRPLLLGASFGVRAANALGLRRRRLAPMDLEAMDRETRDALARGPEGEAMLARYASPFADLRSTATGAYLQALAAVTGPAQPLADIRAPALALVSAQAAFTDPRRVRAALSALPDCEIQELPARHWIPTEQPEAMRVAIEAWMARRFPAPVPAPAAHP
jgi:pimeloyl-ACP methyl ester carboxylesterase